MSGHPIRLLVEDDLQRTRLTVFFRWLLAIPHYFWSGLWSIAVLFAVIASWVATLITGRSPRPLHNFLAAYVKYITQLYAYLDLAADPYPPFDGRPGYPIDVAIEPPGPQKRLSVAFRGILALPGLLLASALAGAPTNIFGSSTNISYSLGLIHVAAFLGWFAILARGAMPRGLRDLGAYCLSYGAQFWGYALLLTDRYPNSDPEAALPQMPPRRDPIRFELSDDLRRSRLTVLFRLLLAFPHLVWLGLWGILALPALLANWIALLIAGRSPAALRRFLSAYLRYHVHVNGFLYLVANPFPGFTGARGSYPLEVVIEPSPRQGRWRVAFRLLLAIPALILASAYSALAVLAAMLGWFASLATGRMPLGLRNSAALSLRYYAQTSGYLLLLTDSYPYSGPSAPGPLAAAPPAHARLEPPLPPAASG